MQVERMFTAVGNVIAPDIFLNSFPLAKLVAYRERREGKFKPLRLLAGIVVVMIGAGFELAPYAIIYASMMSTGHAITPSNMLQEPIVVGTSLAVMTAKTIFNAAVRHPIIGSNNN